jgi:hypothetical protein
MPANSKLLVGDQFNRPAPQYYNPVTDQYEYLYGSEGALHVKLVPSGAAIAAELSVSQRDIVARAIDDIIDTIGLENIACFLPMWENSGSELRDLIDPSLKFRVNGATPGVIGPFGSAWAFDGVNDYIEEAPAIETAAGTAEAALDAGNKMLAQRLKPGQLLRPVAIVRLSLRRVGSPSGTLVVELREDSGGVPGSTVVATSLVWAASVITTTTAFIGFSFSPPVTLDHDKQYWLVLKWQSATTVDAANHVTWTYDSTGVYGEPRAAYDGTAWAATTGQSHGFMVYYDHLALTEGSYILSVKPLVALPNIGWFMSHAIYDGPNFVGARFFEVYGVSTPAAWRFVESKVGSMYVYRETNFDRYVVLALTISRAASTDKFVGYWNAEKVGAVSGTAGQASSPPYMPLTLGASQLSTPSTYAVGHIGGLIVARTPLTQQQIANVTRHVLALRRYKVSGV